MAGRVETLLDLAVKGIKRPHRIPWFLRRLVKHKIPHETNKLYYRRLGTWEYNERGVDHARADYDNLVILDACRGDMFPDDSSLPGDLKTVASRASNTTEWLKANFNGRDLSDTVYVTANPMYVRRREQFEFSFHDVVNVWDDDVWDDEYNTILPETTVEYAIRAAEEYPNKRLLIHFVQPHYPFLSSKLDADKVRADPDRPPFWSRLQYGEIDLDPDRVWAAYVESLDRTLPHLEDLLDALPGKTVVSADHGNMVGERAFPIPIRYWGHPAGIYTDQLVEVPWLEHVNGDRKEIVAGEVGEQSDAVDEAELHDRLRDLGYQT